MINNRQNYQSVKVTGVTLAAVMVAFLHWQSVHADDSASNVSTRTAESLAVRCEELRSFYWPKMVVEEAKVVPAGPVGPATDEGPAPPAKTKVPAHCMFRAVIAPRTGAQGQQLGIGIDLRLPLEWNGRFAFEGGGGLDGIQRASWGSVWGTIMPPALARGFAVVSTDGGHRSPTMSDPQWALDQQARIDYAYNAVDKTTLVAKSIINRFYGEEPSHSYFLGCSNGGRQAMMVSQRMPLQFDGVVSGDPSHTLTRANIGQAWNEIVIAPAAPKDEQGRPILSKAISPQDLQLVADAVREECDGLDGLEDGMINDFKACAFDPAVLTCKGKKNASCMTSAQITALKKLMTGPADSNGNQLYASYPYDTGIAYPAFHRMHFGTSETGVPNSADSTLGFGSLRYLALTPPDPDFDPMQFDFDKDSQRTLQSAKINDADSVFMETFARQSKLILYHGLSDQGLSPLDTAAWYDQVKTVNGPNVEDWARLFLVPGMVHCAGGPATDQFDMLTTIQAWVEEDLAPDRIIASGESFPGITRLLCPYPKIARYKGGDTSKASSFVCSE